jgi:hypothetical protein
MHKFIVALTAAALLAALAMRKSITLSRRPIRLANDAEWDIFCGIVSLSKDILGKIVRTGAIIALLTGAASAQMPMPGINLSPDRQMTPEEKEKQKVIGMRTSRRSRRFPIRNHLRIRGGLFAQLRPHLSPSRDSNGSDGGGECLGICDPKEASGLRRADR